MPAPLVRTVTSLSVLTIALSACANHSPDPRSGPALVEVTSVANATGPTSSYTGVVSARVQSDLGFRVPGKVVARLIDMGETVHRGQPLMRIDRTDYGLGATAATNTVAAARARAEQTAADEKRYRDLVSAGAVSASRYDQARADADAARAQLAAALAQANVARNEAGYSVILADADGIVVQTLAEPGQVVSAGQVVIRLAHAGPREATIDLPESVRPTTGSTATATLYGGSGEQGPARLRQLSGAADPQTRTFEARYVLEGAAARAPLGSTVSIALPDGNRTTSAGAQVPLSAIFDGGHGPGIWRILNGHDGATVHWTPVTLAAVGDETATLSGGIEPGARFVALGAHALHEGEAVKLANTKLAVQP